MTLPIITAVMPTMGYGPRVKMAKLAMKCFLAQTYPNRKLLILNHGVEPILDNAPCQPGMVQEVKIHRSNQMSLGEVRNLAFTLAESDYWITWDDDDWHHPTRMTAQFNTRKKAKKAASVLASYTTIDLATGRAFVRTSRGFRCGGCCGTILFKHTSRRYPHLNRHEDAQFAESFAAGGQLAVCADQPTLYLRTYHGGNSSPRNHVLNISARQRRPLTASELAFVQTIIPQLQENLK